MSRPNVPVFYLVFRGDELTLEVADNVSLGLAQVMLEKLRALMNVSRLVTQDLLYRVEQQLIDFLLELIAKGELREWPTASVPGYAVEWRYSSHTKGQTPIPEA